MAIIYPVCRVHDFVENTFDIPKIESCYGEVSPLKHIYRDEFCSSCGLNRTPKYNESGEFSEWEYS